MTYRKPLDLDLKEGALHKTARKSAGEKFSVAELEELQRSKNPKTAKRANFALVSKSWRHTGPKRKRMVKALARKKNK